MSIDNSTHSLFGVSKAAADLLVQEYGKYFHLKTACLGADADRADALEHAAARFLAICEVHQDWQEIHDIRIQGQAGEGQYPLI
jgi:CDP-paratose 2-epimerase